MYSVGAATVVLGVIVIWLGILSYLFWREKSFFNKLFPKSKGIDSDGLVLLRSQFAEIEAGIEESRRREEAIRKSVRELSLDGLRHIQKLEMIRYNPYEDTGGSMSFSIVFLDGRDNGLLVTSLHTRSGTRIYTKKIEGGKCELHLSKEEDEVLKLAIAQ